MQQQSSESEISLSPLGTYLTFKNGAICSVEHSSAEGSDGKGSGMLQWPSGGSYRGEFLGLRRDGEGEQLWPAGSVYKGGFKNNQREGSGQFKWSSGHEYCGDYSHDKRDGYGVYKWPSGAIFTGNFAENTRKGFGTYTSPSGEKYEGNYYDDIRHGEGVVSYPCGRQDVGIWRGHHLVELKYPLVEAYFQPNRASDRESLKSPDYTLRGLVSPRGYLETASSDLFQAAAQGDYTRVTSILRGGAVFPDVVDSDGHSPLFVAAIHGQVQVVNILLDNAASINRVDKNGLSILSACLHILTASSPAVEAVLMKKFSADLHSSSTTLTSSEYTLHTSDFGSTGSEVFQVSWRPKRTEQEVEETEEEEWEEEVVIGKENRRENLESANSTDILPTEDSVDDIEEEFLSANKISSIKEEAITAESNTPVVENPVDVLSSTSSSSISSTVLPSRLCDTRDQPSVQFLDTQRSRSCLPVIKQSILPLDLSMSKHESYQFGSVVSAAESTSIPNSETSPLGSISSSELSNSNEECSTGNKLREVVCLLLQRNANPDNSPQPLPPLFYAILSGDYELVCMMISKGVSLTAALPPELEGELPLHAAVSLASQNGTDIARALLMKGVDPMLPAAIEDTRLDFTSHSDNNSEGHGWTAIHTACDVSKAKATELVLACVQLLVEYGSSVNHTSRGHSPLSLAIVNGHDEVAEYLLKQGADPNIILRPGVGNALCACTTNMAHRKRIFSNSIQLVHQLLASGANLLMPVPLKSDHQDYALATVLDFAHEAFKEDKRLSQFRYMALSKPERIRYKATRKLIRYILCLLRIKAVENIVGIEKLIAEYVPSSQASSPLTQQRVFPKRSMSAVPKSCHTKTKPLIPSHSIEDRKREQPLPVHTLRESLKFINNTHNLVRMVSVLDISSQLPLVLERVKQLLRNSFLPQDEQWTLNSFCYKCGRSGVNLVKCSGCDAVSFCSQSCKDDCWRSGHRVECITTHVHNLQATSKMHKNTNAKARTTGAKTLTTQTSLQKNQATGAKTLVNQTSVQRNQTVASTKDGGKKTRSASVSSGKFHNVSEEHSRASVVAAERVKNSSKHYTHLKSILNSSAHF